MSFLTHMSKTKNKKTEKTTKQAHKKKTVGEMSKYSSFQFAWVTGSLVCCHKTEFHKYTSVKILPTCEHSCPSDLAYYTFSDLPFVCLAKSRLQLVLYKLFWHS